MKNYNLIDLYSLYFDIDKVNLTHMFQDISVEIKLNKSQVDEILKLDIFTFYNKINQLISESIDTSYKKDNGVYFTHDFNVIKRIIQLSIDTIPNNLLTKKKVLDPACGTGIYSIVFIYEIFNREISKNSLIDFINNYLVNIDISIEMIAFTKINILTMVYYLYNDIKVFNDVKPNIYAVDFIYQEKSKKVNLFNYFNSTNNNFINDNFNNFDIVIGNPPYVSLYGRRAKNKSEDRRQFLIQNYDFIPKHVKNGKFNYTMFFIENGLQLLKKNGTLTFIVDITLLESSFELIRKFILENTNIKQLDINLKAFSNVASGQIIICLIKNDSNKDNIVNIKDWQNKTTLQINQDVWLKDKFYRFKISDDKINSILLKVYNKSNELQYYFPKKELRTSTMLLNMESSFVKDYKPETQFFVMPYYKGAKNLAFPFQNMNSNLYFVYDTALKKKINDSLYEELLKKGIKNKKRIGLGNLDVFKNPKLFIRQSANKLIATYDDKMSASNNSLYILSKATNDKKDIKMLKITCAQLNSELMTFIALTNRVIRKAEGKQPQIKLSDLKTVPLCFSEETNSKLLTIAEDAINKNVDLESSLKKINQVLYKYYGINNEEIEFIKNYINSN